LEYDEHGGRQDTVSSNGLAQGLRIGQEREVPLNQDGRDDNRKDEDEQMYDKPPPAPG